MQHTGSVDDLPDLQPLVGCVVGQLALDYRVTFNLASRDDGQPYGQRVDALLVVEAPFDVTRSGGSHRVEPDTKANYEQTIPFLHATVTEVRVGPDESLELRFSGDQVLSVSRTPYYEAWQLNGHGIQGWIAGPR